MRIDNIAEPNLLIYYLAVEKEYFELLELYGLLSDYSKCKKCGHESLIHFKIIKEIINTFGGYKQGIQIPKRKELERIIRDLTIWKGLSRCNKSSLALRVEEYASRFKITVINIYKIRVKIQSVIDKFQTMKRNFKERGKRKKCRKKTSK